jgi:hypothetical protein
MLAMKQNPAKFDSVRFRTSPSFTLVHIQELSSAERQRLGGLDPNSSWSVALVPAEPGWRRVHLVSAETAAWLGEQRVAGKRPASVDRATAARLVLDGILEVKHAGRFLSGPAAHPRFFSGAADRVSGNQVQALSLSALCYAEALDLGDPLELAHRLYRFNTRPRSPRWQARLPDSRAVAQWLEGSRSTATPKRRRRVRDRTMTTREGGRAVWRIWDCAQARTPRPGAPSFKLYVSPDLEVVGEAWQAVMDLFSLTAKPYSVKIGSDLASLLRPDKLVAYFARYADLLAAAARLRRGLAGMPAQGVPFTATLGEDALLSWAADPSDTDELGPRRQGSWRGWITARLAAALATGRASDAAVSPSRFALDRVSLDGVDTTRWIRPGWLDAEPRFDADH